MEDFKLKKIKLYFNKNLMIFNHKIMKKKLQMTIVFHKYQIKQ